MKEKQINKLYDLYGMTNNEASAQWKCSSYVGVLQHKINRAKIVQKELLEVHLLKRDISRIKRIGDSIVHNLSLLKEVD